MLTMRAVRNSGNRKLGQMGATYRPVGPTCPTTCAMLKLKPKRRGHKDRRPRCYAKRGLAKLAQLKSSKHHDRHEALAGLDLVRHLVSGDAMFLQDDGTHCLDTEYVTDLLQFHQDYPQTQGYGYTHDHALWDQAGCGPDSWPSNLLFLASVDNRRKRDAARAAGWKTARIIQRPEDADETEVLCPYDLAKHNKIKPVPITCRTCQLCWKGTKDIAFIEF